MANMHYYQFNIGDYRRDTQHLSMLEHGAYRQLLDWIYLEESPIPRETEVVFRRLCARTKEEQNAVEIVLKELFDLTEDGYIQGKCMSIIAEYHCKASRARDNGKLGGRPKKTKVVISDNPEETQEKANSRTQELKNSLTQELNNQGTKNKEESKTTPEKSPAFVLPDWIDSEKWALWLKTRKKKMIVEQMQAQVEKLNKWRIAGLDYAQALADAADAGWQGLQEPRKRSVDKHAALVESNKAALAEWLQGGERVINEST